jgi:hypothetical protein
VNPAIAVAGFRVCDIRNVGSDGCVALAGPIEPGAEIHDAVERSIRSQRSGGVD